MNGGVRLPAVVAETSELQSRSRKPDGMAHEQATSHAIRGVEFSHEAAYGLPERAHTFRKEIAR
jgi:hypothetical protein